MLFSSDKPSADVPPTNLSQIRKVSETLRIFYVPFIFRQQIPFIRPECGNPGAASGPLQAFLNELEALRGQQLSSEAYALLYYNGQYLLEQLTH